MNTNMKNYSRDTLSRLGGASRTAWACLGVVLLRAGRRSVLLALVSALNLLPAGRVAAQTFTTLHSFTGGDGANPYAELITNSSGNTLYGTARNGGSGGAGTVFALNTDGTGFTNLHSFAPAVLSNYLYHNSDGAFPYAGLLLSGSSLYGTTWQGNTDGSGTVFAVNTNGTGFTNLLFFDFIRGAFPQAGLILSGNTLYGTAGTLFALNTDGTGFTNLYNVGSQAELILSGNTLYGTAYNGGSSGNGTVFAVNTHGMGFTNLHNFTATSGNPPTNSDGASPGAGLVTNSSGNTLYGTASQGGSSGNGTVFAVNTDGTGFTNLYSFTATSGSYPNITNSDGANPQAGLILSGNTLYGTAQYGGISGSGTVFALNTDGAGFTTLHSFTPYPAIYYTNGDGANPLAGLILSGNTLYGTASQGGSAGHGTVFSLSLRPQLTIVPSGVPPSGIILSWPTNVAGFDYTGYTLQSATNLVSPVWSTNSPAPVVIGGQNTVTNPITGPQQFFRLIH
jgi:uncharacterized repeat protein (TIGR03803 family)